MFFAEVASRVVICAGSFVEVAMPRMAVIRLGVVKWRVGRFARGGLLDEMKWTWPPPRGGEPRLRIYI